MAEQQTRPPVDQVSMQQLIAKIKKGDQDNAEAISSLRRNSIDVEFDSDELVFTKGRMVVNG